MYISKHKPSRYFRCLDVACQIFTVGLRVFQMNLDRRPYNLLSYFTCNNIFYNQILLFVFPQHLKMHSPNSSFKVTIVTMICPPSQLGTCFHEDKSDVSFSHLWPSLRLTVVSLGLVHDTWSREPYPSLSLNQGESNHSYTKNIPKLPLNLGRWTSFLWHWRIFHGFHPSN